MADNTIEIRFANAPQSTGVGGSPAATSPTTPQPVVTGQTPQPIAPNLGSPTPVKVVNDQQTGQTPSPLGSALDSANTDPIVDLFNKVRDRREQVMQEFVSRRKAETEGGQDIIDQFNRVRAKREQVLQEFQERRRAEAEQAAIERLTKFAGATFAASQAVAALNSFVNAQISASAKNTLGNRQEAELEQTQAGFEAAGNATQLVGAGIGFAVAGPIGAAIGAGVGSLVKGIGELFTAQQRNFQEQQKAFETITGRAQMFSPELAQSRAEREINQIRLQEREAETLGPKLAELEQAKAQLETVNAIRSLNENISKLDKQIQQTNEETLKQIEQMERIIESYKILNQDTTALEKALKEMKEAIDAQQKAQDGTWLDELEKAGTFDNPWAKQPERPTFNDPGLGLPIFGR